MALGLKVRADRRIEEALLRVDQLLRLAQRGLRRRNRRIGLERLFDERIQRRRLKQLPPLEGNIPAGGEMLDLAAVDLGRPILVSGNAAGA